MTRAMVARRLAAVARAGLALAELAGAVLAPAVLARAAGVRAGGRCRSESRVSGGCSIYWTPPFRSSSTVEQRAVNATVPGSNPGSGAKSPVPVRYVSLSSKPPEDDPALLCWRRSNNFGQEFHDSRLAIHRADHHRPDVSLPQFP